MQNLKFAIKVVIEKDGEMLYYSQLDLLHILERALRRTDLPLYFTQGFRPHVKISFRWALRLGVRGSIETTFYFTEPVSFSRLKFALGPQLPEGLSVNTP